MPQTADFVKTTIREKNQKLVSELTKIINTITFGYTYHSWWKSWDGEQMMFVTPNQCPWPFFKTYHLLRQRRSSTLTAQRKKMISPILCPSRGKSKWCSVLLKAFSYFSTLQSKPIMSYNIMCSTLFLVCTILFFFLLKWEIDWLESKRFTWSNPEKNRCT